MLEYILEKWYLIAKIFFYDIKLNIVTLIT